MISGIFFQSFKKKNLWVFVLRRLVHACRLYKWDTVPGHMMPLLWCKACFCCIIQSSCYNKYHKLLRFLCYSCYFCYDKVLDGRNLQKDRCILAHSLRVKLSVMVKTVAAGLWGSWLCYFYIQKVKRQEYWCSVPGLLSIHSWIPVHMMRSSNLSEFPHRHTQKFISVWSYILSSSQSILSITVKSNRICFSCFWMLGSLGSWH